jgi:hypothetical protein
MLRRLFFLFPDEAHAQCVVYVHCKHPEAVVGGVGWTLGSLIRWNWLNFVHFSGANR